MQKEYSQTLLSSTITCSQRFLQPYETVTVSQQFARHCNVIITMQPLQLLSSFGIAGQACTCDVECTGSSTCEPAGNKKVCTAPAGCFAADSLIRVRGSKKKVGVLFVELV